jgi:CRP-like cAMP-binding protein
MKRHTNLGNRLLAALPPADLGLLAPHLQQISLKQDAVLVRSGDRNDQVYFPHSGTISFMLDMPTGQTVATSVIGHEGAVGMLSVLGSSRSPATAVVRVAEIASQISASRFHAAFGQSSAIKHAVQTHTRAVLMQLQHVAACNALHPVEARMARWLLHIHDRIDGNAIPLMRLHPRVRGMSLMESPLLGAKPTFVSRRPIRLRRRLPMQTAAWFWPGIRTTPASSGFSSGATEIH